MAKNSGCFLPLLVLAACSSEAPPPQEPPEVQVIVVQPRTAKNVVEIPGRVGAVRHAEVRARVDGIVERLSYREGSDVEAGAQLFLIDPRELRAAHEAASAALVRAQATAANAAQDVERYKGLVADGAISAQENDAAIARLRTAQADVAQSRALLNRAKLDLDNTIVTAPIAGRAGRALVTEGALVSASSATLLTTIEQLDPVHVNFSQSSGDVLRARQEIAAGTLQVPELQKISVKLVLENGSEYEHLGRLDFFSLSIDESTGTAAFRAIFPNPREILLPGQFVRARLAGGIRPDTILVPQRAITMSPQGATVLVVSDDGMANSREIEVGSLIGGAWVVREGLASGERVIVEGLQKVRPGQPVRVAAPSGDGVGDQQR